MYSASLTGFIRDERLQQNILISLRALFDGKRPTSGLQQQKGSITYHQFHERGRTNCCLNFRRKKVKTKKIFKILELNHQYKHNKQSQSCASIQRKCISQHLETGHLCLKKLVVCLGNLLEEATILVIFWNVLVI